MNRSTDCEAPESREESATDRQEDTVQTLWHWFAVGLLLFCWIAEASMCADRGF